MGEHYAGRAAAMDVSDCSHAQHPTGNVLACSPDPVLTHDGRTSAACRGCDCGGRVQHMPGCARGFGGPTQEEREAERLAAKKATVERLAIELGLHLVVCGGERCPICLYREDATESLKGMSE